MKNIISILKVLPLALLAVFVSCQDDDEEDFVEVVEALPQTGVEGGYGYVDLGLPSKTMWATCNVGGYSVAKTPSGVVLYDSVSVNGVMEKRERRTYSADLHGFYFSWGEVTGYDELVNDYAKSWKGKRNTLYNQLYEEKTKKTIYLPDFYKWGGSEGRLLKYNFRDEPGAQDNKDELEYADDAAAQRWGGKWHMPTREQVQELIDNCYWVYYHNYNGTKRQGYVIFRVKDDADKNQFVFSGQHKDPKYTLNDPHIFIRYSGFKREKQSWNLGMEGTIWTSSLNSAISTAAHCLYMTDRSIRVNNCDRFTGRPVRAVFEQ